MSLPPLPSGWDSRGPPTQANTPPDALPGTTHTHTHTLAPLLLLFLIPSFPGVVAALLGHCISFTPQRPRPRHTLRRFLTVPRFAADTHTHRAAAHTCATPWRRAAACGHHHPPSLPALLRAPPPNRHDPDAAPAQACAAPAGVPPLSPKGSRLLHGRARTRGRQPRELCPWPCCGQAGAATACGASFVPSSRRRAKTCARRRPPSPQAVAFPRAVPPTQQKELLGPCSRPHSILKCPLVFAPPPALFVTSFRRRVEDTPSADGVNVGLAVGTGEAVQPT